MQDCQMNITTTVDGESKTILRTGKMQVADATVLVYEEERTRTQITLRTGEALLERFGEYTLRLPLRVGERTFGSLSFGGSAGEIPVETLKIERRFDDADVEAILEYRLVFENAPQNTRLFVRAREKKV